MTSAFAADDDDEDTLAGRSLEQLAALNANLEEVIQTAAFYAATSVLLVVLVIWAVVQRRLPWAFYALIALASLWWLALHEQNLSGLFWVTPQIPTAVIATFGMLIAAANVIMAASVSRAEGQKRRLKVLCGLAALVGVIWLGTFLLNDATTTLMSIAVFGTAALTHLIPMIGSSFRDKLTVRPIQIVGLMMIVVGVVALIGEFEEELDLVFLNRIAAAGLTFAFLSLFLYRNSVTMKERDAAVRQSIEDARREAKTAEALLVAEKKYHKARDLADARSLRLATASHDIRQPIAALRTTMASLTQEGTPEARDQMNTAFDYLNDLAATYIEEGKAAAEDGAPESERLDPKETMSASLLAETIERMFQSEAEGKGLSFTVDVTDSDITTDPLKLMRIMSNLTSNAIKHTTEGTVAFMGAPDDAGYMFKVVNSAVMEDPDAHIAAFSKGESSEGSGLGLSIVKEIVDAEGFDFALISDPSGQTTAKIHIPNQDLADPA